MDTILKKIKANIDIKKLTSNPMLYGLLSMFLSMYGPRLSPKLPPVIKDMFNNKYFRFCIILLITYLTSKNLQLALIVSIGFCLITSYTNSKDVEETFLSEIRENYSDFDTIRDINENFNIQEENIDEENEQNDMNSDNEQNNMNSDNEQNDMNSDNEQNDMNSDNEQNDMNSDNEQNDMNLDNEQNNMNLDNEQNNMNLDNDSDLNGNKAVMHLTYNDIKTGNQKSIKLNCNANINKENFSNMKNIENKIINSVNKYKNPLN